MRAGGVATVAASNTSSDRRGSWIPTWPLVATRLLELRRRRGLMIALAAVTIGLPTIFLVIRLIMHVVSPRSYGPAGGYDIFNNLVAGILYVFGFVMAATLGATAGSSDLTDGMFRHLVITGRSRLALYLARIPAGLAIIASMVAIGFAVVCFVCCFAAPKVLNYDGLNIAPGLTQSEFVAWAKANANEVVCDFDYQGLASFNPPCGPNGGVPVRKGPPGSPALQPPTKAQVVAVAEMAARQNYAAYTTTFVSPPVSLMVESGLWLLLEAAIGFVVGLGLGSLLGQRTVPVVLMIVLEVILTPLFAGNRIPYMLNVQRAVVGIATAHLEPNGLDRVFGAGGGPNARAYLTPETTTVAILVVLAWLIGWTALGAWRMVKRDA